MGSKVRLELKHCQMQFVRRGDSKSKLRERKRKTVRANRKTQEDRDRMKKVQQRVKGQIKIANE